MLPNVLSVSSHSVNACFQSQEGIRTPEPIVLKHPNLLIWASFTLKEQKRRTIADTPNICSPV